MCPPIYYLLREVIWTPHLFSVLDTTIGLRYLNLLCRLLFTSTGVIRDTPVCDFCHGVFLLRVWVCDSRSFGRRLRLRYAEMNVSVPRRPTSVQIIWMNVCWYTNTYIYSIDALKFKPCEGILFDVLLDTTHYILLYLAFLRCYLESFTLSPVLSPG